MKRWRIHLAGLLVLAALGFFALAPGIAERQMNVIDGQPLGNVEQVDVRGADVSVRLCFLDGHDFTRTMFGKIIHA